MKFMNLKDTLKAFDKVKTKQQKFMRQCFLIVKVYTF